MTVEDRCPVDDCEGKALVAPAKSTPDDGSTGETVTLDGFDVVDDEPSELARFEILRPLGKVKASPVVASVWCSILVNEEILEFTQAIACSALWQYQLGCLTLR